MMNPWNLPAATIRTIEKLEGSSLDSAARQLLSGNIDDMDAEARRAAIAEYVADGGTLADFT